jgi:DNA-binding transcriptional regulator YiaG
MHAVDLKARSISQERHCRMRTNELNHWNQMGFAERLREIREELYGEHGSQFLADALEIPLRTWLNYESGVVVPAQVALQLIVLARVNPYWLLTGQAEKYVHRSRESEAGIGYERP